MSTYPVSLLIEGRPCYVIGGGRVAERKIEGLLAAGGKITVISPRITPRIEQWFEQGRIAVELRPYREGDLEHAALVFAATDDESVNIAVCREANGRGLWVNDAMSAERSTFHVPAVLRRGGLTVAVSTEGSSPMLASRLRDELADAYGDAYGWYVELLGKLRKKLSAMDLSDEQRRERYIRWLDAKDEIISALERDPDGLRTDDLIAELLEEARE